MSWPLASHFSTMLQNPRLAFRDPRLQRAAIEKNECNQPRPWAGAFAVVYKGIDPDGQGPFAARVFTTESPQRRERYDLISAYLKARRLKSLVSFEYRDSAIRSAGDGKWYPLILMEWVQGDTLFQWSRARALEGNREAFAQVADRWLEAVQELSDARIAHGDLQHANVMVTPAGEIKLVDYDGMCVPDLVGRRNLEVGVEPYQHPDRNATTLLSLDLDNFSALVIYVALRALALQPGLWLKYVEQIGYDKLLFRSEDFQLPAQSPLRYDLTALGSTDLTALTEKLFALAQARMEDVPPLGQLANSYAEVERQLVAGNWDTAVELLNRRGHFRDAPRRLQPLIYQAYEHVCRQQAWAKFAKIPPESNEEIDRQLVEAWNEALFANFPPAEQARPRVEQARRHVQALDRLRHLIQRTAGRVSLAGEKNLAALAAQLPQGYRHGLQQRADLAARRITAFARLEQTMTQPATEAAIVAAWQAIVAAQCQSLVSIEWGMRIALAEERVTIFQHLAKIPRKVPLPERDRRILALWKEPLMADCPEADPWRPIYQMAAVRREVLKRLQAAIEAHDDAAVLQWGGKRCLAKFPLPKDWIAAIRAARERLGRTESLLAALAEASQAAVNGSSATAEPADEALNVATGEDLPAAANGPATAEPATSPPAAPAQAPPEALGGTGAIAGACAGTGETPVPPAADAPATAELPQSPIPNPQSPIPAAPDALPSALHEQFDVRIVRAQAERFVPYQAFLSEWIRAELLDPQQLGLALPADQPALAPVEQPEGNYRAQWAWPEPRLADQCLLAVCPAEPVCDEDPQQLAAHWRASVSHDEWSAGGGLLIPVERGWEGCWVALWAVVDAGFQKFVSRPLVLGTIESRFRWKWPRLFSRRSEEEKV